MSLKKLLIGVTLFSLAGAVYSEPPEVRQEQMMWFQQWTHQGRQYISVGYDTDGDRREDTRFMYYLEPVSGHTATAKLLKYGIDKNRDRQFEDDEYFDYEPKFEEIEENPKNSRI